MILFSNVFISLGLTSPLNLDCFGLILVAGLFTQLRILFVTHIRISLFKVGIVRAIARIRLPLERMIVTFLSCK